MPTKIKLHALLRRAEIDRAVFFSLLSKIWSIIAGPVTALFIATKFTPNLQGYYYTFASILAFQFLIELGLGNVIMQFASHEWSKLSLDKTGQIFGENEALSRLQSLAKFAFRWYCIASIILTIGLIIGGYFFFSSDTDATINWILPWVTLCILNGVLFLLVPIWSLLEGCNQVSKLYTYRFIQGLCSSISIWIAIFLGAELWAASVSSLVTLICAAGFLIYSYGSFIKTLLLSQPAGSRIQWRTEIWPLQKRRTITWLVGSFTFTLFTPVLFKYDGPVIAGQFGMTWSVVSAIGLISTSWLAPKLPQFGMLIARREYKELDNIFWHITKIIMSVTALSAISFWLFIYILNKLDYSLADRLLSPLTTGILLVAHVLLIASVPFSSYLRVHKKEPLMLISVSQGILTGLSTLILGKYYSAIGVAIGYLSVNVLLMPFVFLIWYRCRAEWHTESK